MTSNPWKYEKMYSIFSSAAICLRPELNIIIIIIIIINLQLTITNIWQIEFIINIFLSPNLYKFSNTEARAVDIKNVSHQCIEALHLHTKTVCHSASYLSSLSTRMYTVFNLKVDR